MPTGLEEFGIEDDGEIFESEADAETQPSPPVPQGSAEPQAAPDGPTEVADLTSMLERVSLFEGLLPIHLKRIAGLCIEVHLNRGEPIFGHGDPGDGLYLVIEGAVRISRSVSGIGEEALAVLRPGQYFGEMSIVEDDMPRSADAIAHERTRLFRLPKDDLRDLMFVDRELAYELLWRFVRTLGTRLRESNDRLLMLTVSSKF